MGFTRDLEDLQQASGCDYRAELPVEALLFTEPPWSVRQGGGRRPSHAAHMLYKDAEQGFFMVADFDFDSGEDAWTQTVAAVRLGARPPGLADFIAELDLESGLQCVLRGDCVYVFVGPYSGRRSSKLKVVERGACLDALASMAAGDYASASDFLASIPASVAWRLGPLVLVVAVWIGWLYFFVMNTGGRGGLIIAGLILASVHAAVYVCMLGQFRPAREYAARRIG